MDNTPTHDQSTDPVNHHEQALIHHPEHHPVTPLTPDQMNQPEATPHKESYRGVITTVILFASAIIVAFLLTSFVFQQYQVDGPSMQPTLHNNDRLIVVKLQRTWADITGHPYIPSRGDIIIFSESGLYNANGVAEKQLVKRVIGLPGERIVISNGIVTIYNKQNPNGFDPDKTLPYGKVIPFTSQTIDEVIPANEVFVCGDNRSDSLDSRYFGPVPAKNIIGKVDLRVYPFNGIGVL